MRNLSPPFIHNNNQVSYVMAKMIIALMPAFILWFVLYGVGSVLQMILCIITCYLTEGVILWLRKKPIHLYLKDNSALVTALLLGFCLPPLSPWWLACCSAFFAMLLGKHVYGGLGQNIFNPAMLGYAIALISFPLEFSLWQQPSFNPNTLGLIQSFQVIFQTEPIPTLSSATLLSTFRHQSIPIEINWLEQPYFYLSMSFLLGGIWMIISRLISWHIPIGVLLGSLFTIVVVYFDNQPFYHLLFHLTHGAIMIGAFFIATDPVSAATSKKGKLCYGLLIGVLIILIRLWGNFPDGIAFAVLIANLSVPLLDYYFKS